MVNKCLASMWFAFFILTTRTSAKFIRVGPCVISWGTECPDPHINFYLYTRNHSEHGEKVLPDENSIRNSSFQPSRINKIIIHGYNSDMNLTSLVDMKNGYLKVGSYNVWMVDWSFISQGPCYPIVVGNVNYVSKCISQMIEKIVLISQLPMDYSVHVIGFSLGAHVAGYLANHLKSIKLSRITGLDPALPLFITGNREHKLDKSDALFVDVIHTDGFGDGKIERSGHVDFYMNGGVNQPGCWNGNVFDTIKCNHHRAPTYFAESITTNVGFYGWKCANFFDYIVRKCPFVYPDTLMGEYCDHMSRGYYIVLTASQSPYAIGHNQSRSSMIETLATEYVTMYKQMIFDDSTTTFQPMDNNYLPNMADEM